MNGLFGGPKGQQASLFLSQKLWDKVIALTIEEREVVASDLTSMARGFGLSRPVRVYVYSETNVKPVGLVYDDLRIEIL